MLLDGRTLQDGATLDTDVCIVGAGPAGLVLGAELSRARRDVVMLESGGDRMEQEVLALNDGDLEGDEYAGLGVTRHRQLGGAAHLWNTMAGGEPAAKYTPLDAADFEERNGRAWSGWPFPLDEVRDDYARAQGVCGIGPFAYDAAAWRTPECEPWSALAAPLVSRVYQLGTRRSLLDSLRATIDPAPNVRLCPHATAVQLHGDARRGRVTHVTVATGGARWTVRAAQVVLATGAVENARLLLVSDDGSGWLGNRSGWVGRCFMEHPRDRALTLRPHTNNAYAQARFYDLHRSSAGTWIVGRLGLSHDALSDGTRLNASATLLPRPRRVLEGARAMLPSAVARRLPGAGHGWSRVHGARALFDGFSVLLNVEQRPHPENRITLGGRRDSFGVPLPMLHWRWRAEDHASLEDLRRLVARGLRGIGTVAVNRDARPDPNAHHHAGTTRMHDDPARGVTDRHGRVHGTGNLYAAGASLFPTAGFANPMLTIVALAVRQARHLAGA